MMKGTTMNRGMLVLAALVLFMPLSQADALTGNGGYDSPYFQADFIQNLSEWTSSLVNPALLYRVNQFHASLAFYLWALDQGSPPGFADLNLIAPIRRNQTFGLQIVGLHNTINGSVITPSLQYDSIGTLGWTDAWIIGSYAVRLPSWPWLALGANLKYRYQHQFFKDRFSNWWPGIDLGIYLNPLDHYRWGDLGVSLNFEDIVPASISWVDTATGDVLGSEPAVTRLRTGLRYALFNDLLVLDVETVLDNAFVDVIKSLGMLDDLQKLQQDSLGSDVDILKKTLRFSFHFKYQFIPQFWLKVGWNNNNIPYLGFNANVIWPLPEMINYLNFDMNVGYSFLEYINRGTTVGGDERGLTMMGRISSDFGPTREQRESKRLYDQLLIAPMDAYNEAMRLYTAKKYWEAGFAFGKVLALYPNFHLNDKATWYLSDCYYRLGMNSISREVCKEALEEYTTSEMRAKYLYGLERLDYREGKFDEALKNHAFIINLYPDNDIRPDADYVAGQIHFERKNYNVAEQLFSSIKPGDTPYLYAQYTLSIINIETEKQVAAIQNLSAVVKDTSDDPAKSMIGDAANLKLGHLYFEQGDKLRQAVEAYQRVPDASEYGDEALLATAWAWVKVNKPDICIQTLDRLQAAHPASPLVPESYLVRGYALMLQKRYVDAVPALERSLELAKGAFVTDQELQAKTQDHDRLEQDFIPTAERIKKNTVRKPTNKTMDERPDLKTEFDKFSKSDLDYFAFTLLAKSHSRFFKQKQQIIDDAEYALAKATKMANVQRQSGGAMEKQEKIDQELEKAKNELQKLQK
jgi:tetratricopeptide (TPR) repeat protein